MHKILIIDDDRDICSLLNRFLTRKGYSVTEIYKGKNAVEYLHENKPDLILSDFRLEDMDGTTLLKKIKGIYQDVPIIIITGYSDVKTAVEIIKSGAFDYVVKPLLPDEILITIQKALASTGTDAAKEPAEQKAQSRAGNEKTMVSEEGYVFGDTP